MSEEISTADPAAEEARSLLQSRVARFGLATSGVLWAFLGYRVVAELASGNAGGLAVPHTFAHVGAAVVMLGMWALCRSGTRSARFVRTVETVGLLGGSFLFQLMGAGT